MYSDDEIVKTAREIRPYLARLLDASTAQQIDEQLNQLLSQAPALAAEPIAAILTLREPTREWMRLALEEHYPAEEIWKNLRTYQPLTGSSNPIESPRYICPVANCHQEWFRRSQTLATPRCPIHNVQFVRDSKTHAPH